MKSIKWGNNWENPINTDSESNNGEQYNFNFTLNNNNISCIGLLKPKDDSVACNESNDKTNKTGKYTLKGNCTAFAPINLQSNTTNSYSQCKYNKVSLKSIQIINKTKQYDCK